MALGDFFIYTAPFTHTLGQTAEIVQHFECIDEGTSDGNAENLNIVFSNNLESPLEAALHPAWTAGIATCQNLTNTSDFFARQLDITPALVGTPLPVHDAVGIRSPKQARGFNRGRHNLPIGDVSWLTGTGRITSAKWADIDAIGDVFGSVAAAGSTGEQWMPVTVRYIYDGDGVFQGVERRSNLTGNWEFNIAVTTVKSRQDYAWVADPL